MAGNNSVAGNNMAPGQRRIALLIDAENVSLACVERAMKEMSALGQIQVRRAYGNWAAADLQGWKDKLHESSIRAVQQFSYAKGKNASDMALVIDAVELLFTNRVDCFCIVSSDSDFTPLVMKLKEHGCDVFGVGKPQALPAYARAFSAFFEVEGVKPATAAIAIKASPPPAKLPPAPKPPSSGSATNKPILKPETVAKLLQAVADNEASSGWAELGAACNHARQKLGVNPKDYKRSHMRALYSASSRFKIVKSANGKSYVADVQNDKRAKQPI